MVEEQFLHRYLQDVAKNLRKAIAFWDAWVAGDIEAEKKRAEGLKSETSATPYNPRSNELQGTEQRSVTREA